MTPYTPSPETTGPEFDPANPERKINEKGEPAQKPTGNGTPTEVGKDNSDKRTIDSDNAGRAD